MSFFFLLLKVGSSLNLKGCPFRGKKRMAFSIAKKRGGGDGLQTPVANARVKKGKMRK